MSTVRSPQYPSIGLKEAIDKAQLIWAKDYTSELPRDVIAGHLGYSGINGKSLGILATLSKYGLLEGRGDKTRVTDLAVKIFAHEQGHPERRAAIQTAANTPSLFQDIMSKFAGRSPSDQALKSFLITRGFTLSGVDAVIRSFRDTEAFVLAEVGAYSEANEADQAGQSEQNAAAQPVAPVQVPQNVGVPTISMSDRGLEISAGVISTIEQFDKLLKRLNAGKTLLEDDDIDS
jgi:hypothetical protein